jgi:hypothetical protein
MWVHHTLAAMCGWRSMRASSRDLKRPSHTCLPAAPRRCSATFLGTASPDTQGLRHESRLRVATCQLSPSFPCSWKPPRLHCHLAACRECDARACSTRRSYRTGMPSSCQAAHPVGEPRGSGRRPTRSCASAPPSGCACWSASCATTATAPALSSSTAPSRPYARPASTSPPAPPSCPSCSANVTTSPSATRPTRHRYDRLLERIETEQIAELVLLGGEVCRRLLATDASVVAWSRPDLPDSLRHVAPSSHLRRSATMCALLDDTSNRSESNPLIAPTGRGCSSAWMCLSPARRTRALPATCGKLDPLAQPFLNC